MILVHQSITYQATSEPGYGAIVIHPDGRFIYTPHTHYHNADAVSYSVIADGGTLTGQTLVIPANPEPEPEDVGEGEEPAEVVVPDGVIEIAGSLPKVVVPNGKWVRFNGTPQLDAGKIDSLVTSGVWTDGDLATHGLKSADPFVVPEGKQITGAETFVVDGDTVRQSYSVTDIPPPSQAELLAYTAEKRRQLANGSTTVNTGERSIPVWTDPESRGAITGLVVASQIVPDLVAPWKGADGEFYQLAAAELAPLALGMMSFVQSCFAAEAAVGAAILATDITTISGIEAADWPE